MKSVCIAFGKGCPRQQIDVALLFDYFEANGWLIVDKPATADLIILSTCGVDARAENESMRFISFAKKMKRSDANMIVFGCLPGVNPKRLESEYGGIAISSKEISKLDEIISARILMADMSDPNLIATRVSFSRRAFNNLQRARAHFDPVRLHEFASRCMQSFSFGPRALEDSYEDIFTLRIGKGCSCQCTYCAIRFATGRLASKPLEKILAEFDAGLHKGYKVFNLLATDLGGYGQDIGSSSVELLKGIFSRENDFKVLISEFNPMWLIKYFDELLEIISKNVINIGFMMIPVQSGSSRILNLMKRGYTAEHAKTCISTLQQSFPNLDLASHVMVGFPGETDHDFAETMNFFSGLNFKNIFMYKYSDRPNTLASKMYPKVETHLANKRLWEFRKRFRNVCKV